MIMAAQDIVAGKMSVGELVGLVKLLIRTELNPSLGHGKRSSVPTLHSSRLSGLSLQRSETSFDRHAGMRL